MWSLLTPLLAGKDENLTPYLAFSDASQALGASLQPQDAFHARSRLPTRPLMARVEAATVSFVEFGGGR